jgi:hypothetical protein
MYPLFFRRPSKKWSTARARKVLPAVKASRHPISSNRIRPSSNLPSTRTKKVGTLVITLYMYSIYSVLDSLDIWYTISHNSLRAWPLSSKIDTPKTAPNLSLALLCDFKIILNFISKFFSDYKNIILGWKNVILKIRKKILEYSNSCLVSCSQNEIFFLEILLDKK